MLLFGQTKLYEVHVMFIYLETIEAAGDRLLTRFEVNDQLQILNKAF